MNGYYICTLTEAAPGTFSWEWGMKTKKKRFIV